MIKVNDLKFSYTSKEVTLKGISFSVEKNKWVSILGHNGSGKSTVSKLLVGLLEAKSGTISIDNIVLGEETVDEIRKKIGIVFQNPDNQFVGYNVKYDIAFGLENRCTPRSEMLKLIDEFSKKVGMHNYLHRDPSTLSGGQKQRVAIAGILALNSDIFIFDEATSMLDPEGSKDIIDLIKDLRREGKTIITITHDLNLAALSDEIIVLKQGEIMAQGTPLDIFEMEEVLESSNLIIPHRLKLYKEAKKDDILNKNQELMESLWELSLKT